MASFSGKIVDWFAGKVTPEVKLSGRNVSLLDAETLTWNGVLIEQNTADINIPSGKEVLVRIDNQANQTLTVTFQHKVGADYIDFKGADGSALTFDVSATTHEIFGPIQVFPRYTAGRITVTASVAPTDTNTTVIQVQEV